MSETTNATVDERARTWAFTALALGTVALMGGGMFATGIQMLTLDRLATGGFDLGYAVTVVAAPLIMCGVSLWMASTAVRSRDSLARSVGRAAQTLSCVAIVGAVLVLAAVFTNSVR